MTYNLLLSFAIPVIVLLFAVAYLFFDSDGRKKVSKQAAEIVPDPSAKLALLNFVYYHTFAPLHLCQQALVESDYDSVGAVQTLKEAKIPASPYHTHVSVMLFGRIGTGVEITAKFQSTLEIEDVSDLAGEICKQIAHTDPRSINDLLGQESIIHRGITIQELVTELGVILGDALEVKSCVRVDYDQN